MNIHPVSPARICKQVPNEYKGTNSLMTVFRRTSLFESFGEIIQDDRRLRAAYIPYRYPANGYKEGMNFENPTRYPENSWSIHHQNDANWELVPPKNELIDRFRKYTKDDAEISLLAELYHLGKVFQDKASTHDGKYNLAYERLLFLQAGIGSGKSTLLHHLSRIVLPKIEEANAIDFSFQFAIIDLNPLAEAMSLKEIWKKLLGNIRSQLEKSWSGPANNLWETLARDEIYNAEGSYLPLISFSPHPERLRNRIIHASRDDLVFIRRMVKYLSQHKQRVVVFVPDNIDKLTSVKTQLALIERLVNLLNECEKSIGLVPLREYTLGDLCNQRDFISFHHVKCQHITTPLLGDMVQKRFDLAMTELDDETATVNAVGITQATAIRTFDVRELFKHIRSAFEEIPIAEHDSADKKHSAYTRRLSYFLHHVTNTNARSTLKLVLSAMESWALPIDEVVTTYFYQRDKGLPIKLPPFTIDKLLRLCSVGCWRFYEQEECPQILNCFSFAGHRPDAENGRFPLLIVHRMLQYFEGRTRINMNQFFNDFSCFGYSADELKGAVTRLQEGVFIESANGSGLLHDSVFYKTRKCSYYFHKLSKMLVFLENVRNDSMIEYKAEPHEAHTELAIDVPAVLEFIVYISDQECKEWAYVQRKGKLHIERYKRIVVTQPVCWKLFKSVQKRCKELYATKPTLFGNALRKVEHALMGTQQILVEQSKSGKIWPPIPLPIRL